MDARRQTIKEEVRELCEALKKLDVEPDDTSATIAKLLRGEAQEVYEIHEWYNQRGREGQRAHLVEARDAAKRHVGQIKQLAAQEPSIDVASELAQAATLIEEKVAAANAAIGEAIKLAKEHGIPFSSSASGVTNTFDPDDGWEHSAIC